MFGRGCRGKITHIDGMLGTGFDLLMCPDLCLNVQPFKTENNLAMIPQRLVLQPSSV